MRKAIYLLLCHLIPMVSFSQTTGVVWGSPINVGTGATHNNIYPRLTLTDNDVPLVIWQDNAPAKVYSSRKNGATFDTPTAVNNSGVSPFVANWAGAEVASSGDTAFVVFTSMPVMSGKAYAVRSIDGGISYTDTVRIDQEVAKLPSFPSVVVLPGGNPIVTYMSSDAGTMLNTEYTVSKSTDGGISFLPTVTPVNPGEACDCCPATMAISGNSQALLFRNNISNLREMWASFSTDECASFPISSNIDTTNWFISSCPSSGPSGAIVGDSLIYTWMSDGTGDSRIYIGTVNINDQQIGQHRQIYPVGTTSQNYPVIAAKGDTVGVVWLGYNGGYQEVLFSWSVTGAAGIGNVVDTITKGLTGHQSRPDIAFNNGKFHVVYSHSMGTQVHYVEGMLVPNVSVNEINSVPALILNASNINGSIEVVINAVKEINADISLVNALGQQIKKIPVAINSGQNKYSIEHQMSPGIYFVVIATNDGKVYQDKIIVAR